MTEPLPFKQVVRLGVFEKATGKRVSTLSLDVVNSQINGSSRPGGGRARAEYPACRGERSGDQRSMGFRDGHGRGPVADI